MGISDNQDDFFDQKSERRRSREEIIRAVTEGEKIDVEKQKFLVIPESSVSDADVRDTASSMDIPTDSKAFELLQIYCEQKNATAVQAKSLMQRAVTLSEEQINLLRLICGRENFRARDILRMVGVVRKLGSDRLLILHAFVALEGTSPGAVERLCAAALPQVGRHAGQEAYEAELREKAMTREQIDVFYNICTRLEGITPGTAIALLPKARSLRPQHAQLLNIFLKKESCFGEKPIDTYNIQGLLNLLLGLNQLADPGRFKKLLKKLSRQPEEKKNDLRFLIRVYKNAVEKEKGPAGKGGLASAFKRFLE